jgi:hypothetical protein
MESCQDLRARWRESISTKEWLFVLLMNEQAVLSLFFCELIILVGGGTFAQYVAAQIGGQGLTSWPSLSVIIFTVALAAPLSQASD